LQFIIVWLLGDVFNILGAVLQGVLPTMIILAIYYTIADLVLLCQCFYYRGFTWRDEVVPPTKKAQPRRAGEPDERTGLLSSPLVRERRGSDWSNLSPAVPMITEPAVPLPPRQPSVLQTVAWNTVAVLMIFGYLCAVLYLGSRLPQLLLNWRRKSTEGVSMLFFLFACLGNLTYVLSIFAYDPKCAGDKCEPGEAAQIYGQYILVNASWLAGSAGTLLLDLGIFVQFFMYSQVEQEEDSIDEIDDEERSIDGRTWDQRPLLQRGDSTYG
jgi:hypothetical protein